MIDRFIGLKDDFSISATVSNTGFVGSGDARSLPLIEGDALLGPGCARL
jgi:hypothetical protein